MSGTTPAGWYDDGQHPGQHRYWDGTAWTDHYAPAPASAPSPTAASPAPPPGPQPAASGRGRLWAWLAPVLAVVVAGGVVLGLWLGGVFGGGERPSDVLQRWAGAMSQRDCVVLFATTTPEFRSAFVGDYATAAECQAENDLDPTASAAFEVVSESVQGDGAGVVGILTGDVGSAAGRQATLTLIRLDGHWVVDTFELAAD